MTSKTSQCPKCASRGNDRKGNNLYAYPDGHYCFACGYYAPNENLQERILKRSNELKSSKAHFSISLDNSLAVEAKKWLLGYSLTEKEMQMFKYGEQTAPFERKSLLFLAITEDYFVARNFGEGVKYVSQGNKPFLKYGDNKDVIVFVEDVISAVKVSRLATAIPMLGSKPKQEWWHNAAGYKRVILWGDRDMARQNIILANRASELTGVRVETIITEKDPKEFNTDEIKKILNL